jgi:hypothetical protein
MPYDMTTRTQDVNRQGGPDVAAMSDVAKRQAAERVAETRRPAAVANADRNLAELRSGGSNFMTIGDLLAQQYMAMSDDSIKKMPPERQLSLLKGVQARVADLRTRAKIAKGNNNGIAEQAYNDAAQVLINRMNQIQSQEVGAAGGQ